MNKAYIISPLVALLIFGAFYWNFKKGYDLKQRQTLIQQEEEQKARIEKELATRKKAIEDAIVAADKRKAEREAKEKKDAAEKAAFDALVDKRNNTFDDVNKRLRPQLDRLHSDADGLKQDIGQLQLQVKQYQDEETFLRTFVQKAQANVKTYTDELEKIAAAEKAHAEAEAAAAKAKKS